MGNFAGSVTINAIVLTDPANFRIVGTQKLELRFGRPAVLRVRSKLLYPKRTQSSGLVPFEAFSPV